MIETQISVKPVKHFSSFSIESLISDKPNDSVPGSPAIITARHALPLSVPVVRARGSQAGEVTQHGRIPSITCKRQFLQNTNNCVAIPEQKAHLSSEAYASSSLPIRKRRLPVEPMTLPDFIPTSDRVPSPVSEDERPPSSLSTSSKSSILTDESDDDCAPRRKKARTAFSSEQTAFLEQHYEKQRYLVPSERSSVADHLGLTDLQVKTWFQNRRMKEKRQHRDPEATGSMPFPTGGVDISQLQALGIPCPPPPAHINRTLAPTYPGSASVAAGQFHPQQMYSPANFHPRAMTSFHMPPHAYQGYPMFPYGPHAMAPQPFAIM